MSVDTDRARTATHMRRLTGMYIHLIVYTLVNLALAILNFQTSPQTLWFYWPLLGWGIGVAAHVVGVLMARRVDNWEAAKPAA